MATGDKKITLLDRIWSWINPPKITPQQNFAQRIIMANSHVSKALVELESANEFYSQANLLRAISQARKTMEVYNRRLNRIYRESKPKKHKSVDTYTSV